MTKPKLIYVLACVDDLARLGEIERLSGVTIPLEARYFPAASDLHAQIKDVRRWASEKGEGANYLVQPVMGGGVRAWRVTSPEASNLLLIRLLPFSKSLETPLQGARLVYQSHWGAYISVHEVTSAAH
jgi:hydroxylamine oxidation protein HaoB